MVVSEIIVKDLNKEFPRSPYDQLGGFPWLPRLIDKVRALQAGNIGEYIAYPCGADRRFLATLELDTDALKALIFSGATDEQIVAWVQANYAGEEKLAEYQAGMHQAVTGDRLEYLKEAIAELQAAHPDRDVSVIANFSHLICVEEGHLIPAV